MAGTYGKDTMEVANRQFIGMAFGHKPLKSLVFWWVSKSACAAQPGVAGVQVVAASNG
jgi:hypothetical protein